VLKVYREFDPVIKALISKVDPSAIRVWQLRDMEKLPTWTTGKLVLIGDAAHPFTPRKSVWAQPQLVPANDAKIRDRGLLNQLRTQQPLPLFCREGHSQIVFLSS
jgi:hypothetical protein